METLKLISKSKCFGGYQCVYSLYSDQLKCSTKFSIYLPPTPSQQIPLIYWLSGLTCSEQNFIDKSGFQKYASKHGFAVVGPDTSPRGLKLEGETDSWDFGEGAGFYVDATEEKWRHNYRMYSFITKELPAVLKSNFGVDTNNQSIMGHSMGGHGALICYLKNPGMYRSVSAFAAICHPCKSNWGRKALGGYLGADEEAWKAFDATCLVAGYKGTAVEILLDQGTEDEFLLKGELLPEELVQECQKANIPVKYRQQLGYNHAYNFVATFIESHFEHHAKYLSHQQHL